MKIKTNYLGLDLSKQPKSRQEQYQDSDIAVKYAIFAKQFLDKGFDCSYSDIKNLIKTKITPDTAAEMEDAGYDSISYSRFFLNNQLNQTYIQPQSALCVLMHIYDANIEALAKDLSRVDMKSVFSSQASKEGYTLISSYRNDIVKLRHEKCGTEFCTSPYGFSVGWRCPECGKALSLQEKYREFVKYVGDDQYEAAEDFVGMDQKTKLRHLSCGRILETKARAFLYEGVRCKCERIIDFEAAKKAIEQYPGFELVQYERTDKPVRITHSCGGTFEMYYMKFLAAPRCRVCQRQGHLAIRTTADMKKDIEDLTGDEYTLLDEYKGPRTAIRIRHNICGNTQTYLPHRFLDGARCRECHIEINDAEFKDYVERYTCGRYTITERPTPNMYRLYDQTTGNEVDLLKSKALQELRRPTPSAILPLDRKNADEPLRAPKKSETLMRYLKEKFTDGIIFLSEIQIDQFSKDDVQQMVSNMAAAGKLKHLAKGIYTFPDKMYRNDEIIIARYIERRGKRIGFFRGADFAAEIGLEEQPRGWHIATNEESYKTPNRKTKFLGETIHIKGMPVEINDSNYLILGVIDFLIQYRQCTSKPEKEVIGAIKIYLKTNNDGTLPKRSEFDHYIQEYKTANIRTMMSRLVETLYSEEEE